MSDLGIALIVGAVIVIIWIIASHISESNRAEAQKAANLVKNTQFELQKQNLIKEKYEQKTEECEKKITEYNTLLATFDEIIKEKCQYYPQLAAIMADLLTVYYKNYAVYLDTKKHPAHKAASDVKELRKDTKIILKEKKELEYKLAYITELYPNINDIFDSGFTEEEFILETDDNTDRVRYYLSDEEYKSLPSSQKNQMALDRYVANRKSKWQIGRDYEMYIGYLYEQKGYKIEYSGIIKNLEDMGRDLIATKENEVLIIQCKNWAKEKTIYEKHIFQLFGTIVLYQLDNPTHNARGLFVTTTTLSDKARNIAEHLHIQVVENKEMADFPRIKCNINKQRQEKIYHLPFDQQYDKVIIEKDIGECYATTVAEAEEKGFRRALRHTMRHSETA